MKQKLILCKTCGKEMAANAKACPSCGAKNKKPFFKRWWFWVVLILVIGSAASSGGEKKPQENPVSQTTESVAPVIPVKKETPAPVVESKEASTISNETMGQKNALKSAKNYISIMAFSYDGLIRQLEFENYSHEDAVYAADNCGADWNEQALKSAKNYLDTMSFSHKGLIKQLEFEKYTTEQATYGADNCGADWNEQAAKAAKNYLDLMAFSRDGLIGQLEFEGYTHEQAVYGAEANGY